MTHRSTIPRGFTAETWRRAIASGRVIEISTMPGIHPILRTLRAPIQFLQWTIRARTANPALPA
jgi:hypothetical protein